jgi:hypothetical protein
MSVVGGVLALEGQEEREFIYSRKGYSANVSR